MTQVRRAPLDLDWLQSGIVSGDRAALGRALTLAESLRADHQLLAQELIVRLAAHTGKTIRVGISGVPGVGKSTFVDSFGSLLTQRGHKVAVLAVDPTSSLSGGSILGDKTRMARLSLDPQAFVRPSPSGGTLGGVAARTREAILLVEAAGYDVVLVETVGVGQSETEVSQMTDVFLVLMLPGGGDELQGIKKGILELADILAVNKCDMSPELNRRAVADCEAALRVVGGRSRWAPVPVIPCSGLSGFALPQIWEAVVSQVAAAQASGAFEKKRKDQQQAWTLRLAEAEVLRRFWTQHVAQRDALLEQVGAGTLTPLMAVKALLETHLRLG